MRIGVHTRELENARIDGTMVYLYNVLSTMQELLGDDEMTMLYHVQKYHAQFTPFVTEKYHDRVTSQCPLWTQTAFAHAVWKDACDVLWMPLHNMPLVRRRGMRTVVTIHDLAFKKFPHTFPIKTRMLLNTLTAHAVRHADAIIAISASTKSDLLSYFPQLSPEQVHVIHHGFDPTVWQMHDDHDHGALERYGIAPQSYVVHVGAIQPRKNIGLLIDAFERLKKEMPHMKLVLVGGDGWLAQGIHKRIRGSVHCKDIVVTGNIAFCDVREIVKNACACVLPSFYEGFGLPGLEAMAVGVPVIASQTSCFPEIFGDGAVYIDPHDPGMCADAIMRLCNDPQYRMHMIDHGAHTITRFTWRDTAHATLNVLRG